MLIWNRLLDLGKTGTKPVLDRLRKARQTGTEVAPTADDLLAVTTLFVRHNGKRAAEKQRREDRNKAKGGATGCTDAENSGRQYRDGNQEDPSETESPVAKIRTWQAFDGPTPDVLRPRIIANDCATTTTTLRPFWQAPPLNASSPLG